jgi:hypothetical protein
MRGNPPLTTKQIIGTYSIRATIQNETKPLHPLLGYEALLENLKQTTHQEIIISVLGTDNFSIILFSNQNMSEIIGILYSDFVLTQEKHLNERLFTNGKIHLPQ